MYFAQYLKRIKTKIQSFNADIQVFLIWLIANYGSKASVMHFLAANFRLVLLLPYLIFSIIF